VIGLLEMLSLSGCLLAGCSPSSGKSRAAPDGASAGQSCSVVASVPYWAQEQASSSFKRNIDLIDHVALFWYHVGPDGRIRKYAQAEEDRTLIELAHEHDVKVLALVTNLPDNEQPDDGGTWDHERVGRIISSESSRAAHIEDLVALTRRLGVDGIYIDYEALPRTYRESFTLFIKELADALHAESQLLAVVVHAKTAENDPREDNGSGAQDWEALHQYVDQLHIMAYNQHTAATAPGPVASIGWFERVIRHAVETTQVSPAKIYTGIPLYAEEWYQNGSGQYHGLGQDMTFAEVQQRKREHGGNERWSDEHQSPYIVFHDQEGRKHIIWFENRRSSEQKLAIMASLGLCNLALWRLGGEDQGFWSLMRDGIHLGPASARAPVLDGPSVPERADAPTPSSDEEPVIRRLWNRGKGHLELAGQISAQMLFYSAVAVKPEYQRSNWLVRMDSGQELKLTSRLVLDSDVRVVLESDGEDERFYSEFPYEGMYVRRLLLRYGTDHFAVFAGKYVPADGIRGHAPIFFGNHSVELRLDRRIGAGASATLSHAVLGLHTLTGHVFHVDTSRLSGEVFSGRDRHRMFDGSLANTGRLDSFLVTLNGGSTGTGIGIAYTLGWGRQKNGDTMSLDEHEYLAALKGNVPLGQLGSLVPSVDVMSLQNARGEVGSVRNILLGLRYAGSAFSLGGAYSMRFVNPGSVEASSRNLIAEILASYDFGRGLAMEAAYQSIREGGEQANFLGVVLSYMHGWRVP
jgi:spore germination protein